LALLFLKASVVFAQVKNDSSSFTESPLVLQTTSGNIYGTLTLPQGTGPIPIALVIAGSGPTDRNGNNPMMKNDGLKQLAHGLAAHGIGSLRYDKRGIGESKDAGRQEVDLRFEDYIEDARQWIALLRQQKRFSQIVVIGHSEGSLIGMIAASDADKFVSIAGAGQSADKILKEQLSRQPQMLQDASFPIIDSLKKGLLVSRVHPMLFSLFRPGVQPYMISWFKYDPQEEIKKLKIPILLVQGTNDLQVTVQDAQRLFAARPGSKLVLIEHMNHVLKEVKGGQQENIAAYNKSELPIAKELVAAISSFIVLK
jgi:pimeloyl-ACP methyl ester carboxylesterase